MLFRAPWRPITFLAYIQHILYNTALHFVHLKGRTDMILTCSGKKVFYCIIREGCHEFYTLWGKN